MSPLFRLYSIASTAAASISLPLLLPYLLLSSKRRPVALQRLGIAPPELRPAGKKTVATTIWIHALSVGETLSAAPLVKQVGALNTGHPVVFSASTRTGYGIAESALADAVEALFYFPYDLHFCVNRISNRVAPALVVLIETDIWPNFLHEMARRRTPVVLANAKLSDRSFTGYRRIAFLSKLLFETFAAVCCQSVTDANRFIRLGVPAEKIHVTGNIKFDQNVDPPKPSEIQDLRRTMGIGPQTAVWVVGSTHEGEESICRQALKRVKKDFPDLLLVVAPRDPARAAAVVRIFETGGFKAARMTEIEKTNPARRPDVAVVDTFGVLRKLYALADVTLVGGSLLKIRGIGGHNPLEPAAFAKPVLFGPHMKNFREIEGLLIEAGGALQVADAWSLSHSLNNLLKNRDRTLNMGQKAQAVFKSNRGAVAKTLAVVNSLLET